MATGGARVAKVWELLVFGDKFFLKQILTFENNFINYLKL